MRQRVCNLNVQVTTKVVVLKDVKVKAHTRTRFGRTEKVRSYLSKRRVACIETTATVSKQ